MVRIQWCKEGMQGRSSLWVVVLLVLAVMAPAAARDGLHEATVPVADRDAEARTAAVKAALVEVLVRLSGDPGIVAKPAGKSLLGDPSRYLQQYQYEGGGAAGDLYLRAGFAAAPLEATLRKRGLALWGRERPAVLVWIAVDDGQKRYLLGSEDATDPLLTELQAAARRQDLQLVLPLLDLEDQSKVTLTGINEGDLDALAGASDRYQPQAVLLGGLRSTADGWRARWALRHAGSDTRWEAGAAPLPALLDQSLTPVVGKLAVRAPSAVSDAPPARLMIRIEGVAGLQDYARVDQYLRELPPVRRAELVVVQGQYVEYLVDLQGAATGWSQALAAGGMLQPVAAGSAPAGRSVYRLRP